MIDDIYSQKVLELAANIPRLGRLASPDASAKAHSRLCGSTVVVDVKVEDGRVVDFSHDVKACALGQASSSLMARHVIGAHADELFDLRDTMTKMLKADGPAPSRQMGGFRGAGAGAGVSRTTRLDPAHVRRRRGRPADARAREAVRRPRRGPMSALAPRPRRPCRDPFLPVDPVGRARPAMPLPADLLGLCGRSDPAAWRLGGRLDGCGADLPLPPLGRGGLRSSARGSGFRGDVADAVAARALAHPVRRAGGNRLKAGAVASLRHDRLCSHAASLPALAGKPEFSGRSVGARVRSAFSSARPRTSNTFGSAQAATLKRM